LTGFWQTRPDGVTVSVKVQPKSRRPGVQGPTESAAGMRLRISVSEAAEDGRANRAACATMAQALGVPVSAVTVILGHASREKTLHVAGEPSYLTAKLEKL
jgi:uncharacterized protein YggU (UPF0235/DUF167 family)